MDKKGGHRDPFKIDSWLDEIVLNPPALNLVYTLKEFQPYSKDFPEMQYKFLCPSIYERNDNYIEIYKNNRPLIYISLGTVIKGAKSFFNKCIEAFREQNVDVIISVGNKFSIEQLKNIPANIKIYNSVPQLRVLALADLFTTHGGMNSINESIYFGVPMIVIPYIEDQPTNARLFED